MPSKRKAPSAKSERKITSSTTSMEQSKVVASIAWSSTSNSSVSSAPDKSDAVPIVSDLPSSSTRAAAVGKPKPASVKVAAAVKSSAPKTTAACVATPKATAEVAITAKLVTATKPCRKRSKNDTPGVELDTDDADEPKRKQYKRVVKRLGSTDSSEENTKETSTKSELKEKPAETKGNCKAKGKTASVKPEKAAAVPKNKTESDLNNLAFTSKKLNTNGNTANFKIVSWNVGGIRAVVKKHGLEYLLEEDADIYCLQEVRASNEQIPSEIKELKGYKQFWIDSVKPGYAGCAIFSKIVPLDVKYGIGNPEFDNEGRCITAEYKEFYLVCSYVPNAGRKLVTLNKRLDWNKDFLAFIKALDALKPCIIVGDMNVAHNEIDLANPKTNTKNAGFTKEERAGMTDFLAAGFNDTFRHFYPDLEGQYTFWTYMGNARARNVGWRLDYFLTSERYMDNINDTVIRSEVFGSDHCPIVMHMDL